MNFEYHSNSTSISSNDDDNNNNDSNNSSSKGMWIACNMHQEFQSSRKFHREKVIPDEEWRQSLQ